MEIYQLFIYTLIILCTPSLIAPGECEMEPFIVNGHSADIVKFPHSAYLYIKCANESGVVGVYICGSSIVNQYLTLTAAHCTHMCVSKTLITVFVGHTTWYRGASATAHSFLEHELYDNIELTNDICLVRLNSPLKFSQNVNRVALMEHPPYNEDASAAGWGKYSVNGSQVSEVLLFASLHIKRGEDCPMRRLEDPGKFCILANSGRFPFIGDSGSALLVRNYIQIGVVSHGVVENNPPVVFFTDTGYYYKWITQRSAAIMCLGGGPGKKKNNTKCTIARDRRAGPGRGKK